MYGLPPDLVKPGVALRELLEHRLRAGAFMGDPDDYVADMLQQMKDGQMVQDVRERPGGIFISVSSRPMPGGGWVATHQDITERRRQDQQRDNLVEQEQRRATVDAAIAAFRLRIEAMLKTVSDSAVAMRTTATTLFASSHKASQRAEGAVHMSNEASANVEIAASAAERAVGVDRRDQPPARPDQRPGRHRIDGGRRHQRPDRLAGAGGAEDRRRDQADPATSPGRPICWRSMPPSRRRAPAKRAADSPSWRRR